MSAEERRALQPLPLEAIPDWIERRVQVPWDARQVRQVDPKMSQLLCEHPRQVRRRHRITDEDQQLPCRADSAGSQIDAVCRGMRGQTAVCAFRACCRWQRNTALPPWIAPCGHRRYNPFRNATVRGFLMLDWYAGHPHEDLLEAFLLGHLDPDAITSVEEHLLICSTCRSSVQRLEQFISAFRAAARELRLAPVNLTHQTPLGRVSLRSEPTGDGQWMATVAGPQISEAARFPTAEQANEFLSLVFAREFPGHRCAEKCG